MSPQKQGNTDSSYGPVWSHPPPPWGSALIGPSQTMGQTMAQTMGQTMAQMDHHNEAEHKLLHCHGCKTA